MSISRRALAGAALAAALLATPAAAVVWEVNASNPLCSDAGAGDAAQPFCTIARGAAAAAAGDTVNVAAGDYREIVVVPADGVTYTGAAGARVLGTENLSGAPWAPASATAWSLAYDPDTNPRQVWVNDVRLTEVTTSPADLVANSFFYDAVAEILTVDVGGPNPGLQNVEAGAYSFGFDVTGRTGVVVQGFEVKGQNTSGIRVRTGTNVTVRGNRVHRARSFGILVEGTATTVSDGVVVDSNDVFDNGDSGIRLRTGAIRATVSGNDSHDNRNHGISTTGTSDSRIAGNELYRNARPGGVSTTGLILDDGSHRIQVERNRAYANQDSGFQVSGTAGVVTNLGNVFVRNVSDANGDHGFDVRESDGTLLVSNTAYGNVNDGFSIEGNSTNTLLRNNVGVNNGVLTGGNDLWVDPTSTVGFSANYDVWHNTGAGTAHKIEYDGVEYDTVTAFRAATGHEQQGSGNDPRLANPGAGDFMPGIGSATDDADATAPGFQALDFFGAPPVDMGSIANTGAGVPNFADRGAVERRDAAPIARLDVAPRRVSRFFPVLASAIGSSDDDRIVSYRFEWGDGTVQVTTSPLALHAYRVRGTFHVRLTVTDSAGQTATVQQPVVVR
jgi:parallel beta-helix repeat protein